MSVATYVSDRPIAIIAIGQADIDEILQSSSTKVSYEADSASGSVFSKVATRTRSIRACTPGPDHAKWPHARPHARTHARTQRSNHTITPSARLISAPRPHPRVCVCACACACVFARVRARVACVCASRVCGRVRVRVAGGLRR